MNRISWLIFATLMCLAAAPGYGQTATKSYDDFPLLRTRNIFDPNRRAPRNEPTQESRSTSTRSRPSYFSLTGTMVGDERSLAFFSGSRTEFSKVIPVGEAVGGYKLLAINPAQVELEHEGKKLVMVVGHRLQIDGSTDEVSEPEPAAPGTPPAAPSSDPNAPATAAPAATSDKAEILRRLIERRQKEMSK